MYIWNAFAPMNILVSSIHKDSSFFNSFNLCVDKFFKNEFYYCVCICICVYVQNVMCIRIWSQTSTSVCSRN